MTKTVILDLDYTLFCTVELREVDPNTGRDFISDLRDGVVEFLEWCRERDYTVIAVTAGVVSFQLDVLRFHGILDYFSGVYGWEDVLRTGIVAPPPLEGKIVILEDNIDKWNLGWKSSIISRTLTVGENVIKVDPFIGPLQSYVSTSLMDYAHNVMEILESE